MPSSGSFKELRVWQAAMRLAVDVYRETADFPKHEIYGLTQQMRRAAVSIPSNIAEGKGHRSNREFSHFLFHARGSLLELQTQMMIATELQYFSEEQVQFLSQSAEDVGRALSGLINSLKDQVA
jgi:four helix bundle protein